MTMHTAAIPAVIGVSIVVPVEPTEGLSKRSGRYELPSSTRSCDVGGDKNQPDGHAANGDGRPKRPAFDHAATADRATTLEPLLVAVVHEPRDAWLIPRQART